jgi:hypothetical protein
MIRKITLCLAFIACLLSDASAQNASRLVARHTNRFTTSWAPFDSATFVYSNGRGGDYYDMFSNRLNYDTSYGLYYINSSYTPYIKYIQTFNGQNHLTERVQIIFNGTTWENDKKIMHTLDGNGNRLQTISQTWNNNAWENTDRTTSTFDGNNNLLTQEIEYWSSGVWVKSYLSVYTYNSNNNMLTNVSASFNQGSQLYDSSYRNEFFYNSNNLADSNKSYSWNAGWNPSGKTVNVYNTNNLLTSWHNFTWANNNWANGGQGFYFYDNNNLAIGDSVQHWVDWMNGFRNFWRSYQAYNSNNMSIMYLYSQWDTAANSFINNYVDSFDYNSFDQVTWYKRLGWDAVNNVWVGQNGHTDNRYYYELYTADVKNLAQTPGELKIYPVPATSNLNIDLNWKKNPEFVVAIYDMQGRLLRQWGVKGQRSYKSSVPVHDLASGNYILKVRSGEGSLEEKFVVSH